jgi:hypothetical protein
MITDYRAVIQRLLDTVKPKYTDPEEIVAVAQAINAAHAALARPESVGPSDEELLRTYGAAKREYCYVGPLDDWPKRAERAATVHGLRAAPARWGRPAVAALAEHGSTAAAPEVKS